MENLAFCRTDEIVTVGVSANPFRDKNFYPSPESGLIFFMIEAHITWSLIFMDKMGIAALVGGLILIGLGIYEIIVFLPEVILALKGAGGIIAIIIGIFLAIFGVLLLKD